VVFFMVLKVLLFSASWCQPCKQVKPIVEELAREYGLSYEEIDIDGQNGRLAIKYGVMSLPCVVFEKDGMVVDVVQGVKPRGFFQGIVERLGGRPQTFRP